MRVADDLMVDGDVDAVGSDGFDQEKVLVWREEGRDLRYTFCEFEINENAYAIDLDYVNVHVLADNYS